jgi:hypothetical protein
MPTFDIWLEDSQGRQFRRSNHYAVNFARVLARYQSMSTTLWFTARFDCSTQFKEYSY